MHIRVMSWNIQHEAMPQGRWPGLVGLIRQHQPDILCLQEVRGWIPDNNALARQAGKDLGMEVHVGRAPGTGNTAIAYRPGPGISWAGMEDHCVEVSRGYSAGRFLIEGLPVPLVVISTHVSCYAIEQALIEVQTLVARARRHGGLGVIAGDINFPPLGDPEPDWSKVQPHNRMIRAIPTDPHNPTAGKWFSNTVVAEKLLAGEMVDVAAHLADARDDPELRAPTGVYGLQRVDQFHVVRAMQKTIVDYYRVHPEGFSDHWGIVADFDLDKVDLTLLREFT